MNGLQTNEAAKLRREILMRVGNGLGIYYGNVLKEAIPDQFGVLSQRQRLKEERIEQIDVVHADRRLRKSDVAHRPRRLVNMPRQFSGCRVHRHALQSVARHI